jgi:hypothetical protein
MKTIRFIIGFLLAFMALNAFAGGYYAIAGAKNVPLEWLEGSPFKNYLLPGLFLFIVIGGSCTAGSIAIFRNNKYALRLSLFCSLLLISWIIIQVAIIGYVSWMQPAVFITGSVVLILVLWIRRATDSSLI